MNINGLYIKTKKTMNTQETNNHLNPESETYYHGFRYEKDWCGDERWYDSNNTLRKEVIYHPNGLRWVERHLNDKDLKHNLDGYALFQWDDKGNIVVKQYWINGVELPELEWKTLSERLKKKVNEPDKLQSDNHYKDFRYEMDEDGCDCWYDENNNIRRKIKYNQFGLKSNEYFYNENMQFHNEEDCAVFDYEKKKKYYLLFNTHLETKEMWEQEVNNIKTNTKSIFFNYLNPTSPFYYKGYRFERIFSYNHPFFYKQQWYDENDVLRKEVCYTHFKLECEYYYDDKGRFHNEDGYAIGRVNRLALGDSYNESFYVHGIEVEYYYWKEFFNKDKKQVPDYLNPESKYYYKGYRYEKDEYNDEYWYDEDGNVRKEITYYDNGDKLSELYFNKKSELHNDDGPALQSWSGNGKIERV